MLGNDFPKAGEGGHGGQIPGTDVDFAVALPLEAQDRIGTHGDAAVHHGGEVDAQKGQGRIGHRVNQMGDNAGKGFRKLVIFPPERNDGKIRGNAGHGAGPVGGQAGAGNEITGADVQIGTLDADAGFLLLDGRDFTAQDQGAAGGLEEFPHFPGDGRIIGDAGGRDLECPKTCNIRFQLLELFTTHGLGFYAVFPAAVFQGGQPFHLQIRGGHQQLTALTVGDFMGFAEIQGGGPAFLTEISLETAGLVVDPGVDHPGVVPGLVGGQSVFLFNDQNPGLGKSGLKGQGRGNADNAAADEGEIRILHCCLRWIEVDNAFWPGS